VNHVLLGAPVGVAVGMPFVVKAHGSELEFTIRGRPGLAAWARESLAEADAILAGSEHIRDVIEEVVGPGEHISRIHVLPPGVDVEEFRPQPRDAAFQALLAEARRDPANPGRERERLPDPGNAERLAEFLAGADPTVVYVGKLSEEKGVPLLVEALAKVDARTVLVGFGPLREELETTVGERILLTGPLEHRHLRHLWPLADASVTPSVFPEAFGMVAAEAAACGSPPLVARHSGLAEIAEGVEAEYPPELRELASFRWGDAADLAAKLDSILALPRPEWERLSTAARRAVEARWSWERIAAAILSL
jgi:glycosyltransferase involved in cell wall biosynthesis